MSLLRRGKTSAPARCIYRSPFFARKAPASEVADASTDRVSHLPVIAEQLLEDV